MAAPSRVLLALLLVAGGLAGCVDDPLDGAATSTRASLPTIDLNATAPEHLTLTVADGTTLDLAVWRPDTTEKVPVIVDIGPYFGNLGGDMMTYTAIDLRMAEYFVPRGYAMARASVRGTGESEGCFDLGGKTEREDVAAIVDFLGKQQWSNGNVAAFGKSYDGTTPWMAALEKPEHLRTIVTISGITDWYRYMFYDGVTYPEELLFNTYYYLIVDDDVIIPGPDGGDPQLFNPDPEHMLMKNVLRTCDGLVPQTLPQTKSTATGAHEDPFWIERDYERLWADVDVPVFMVHGFQDWNVKPDNQLPMFNALDVPKALWVGQWAHDYPDINRFKTEWSRPDWNETLLVWFDHWLKGVEDNGWERLLKVEAQDQTGRWRDWTAWPPPEAREVALHPTASGGLALAAGDGGSVVVGGPLGAVAEFATPALAEDVLLSGAPVLDLTLRVDRPMGHLAVTLYDEAPDGARTHLDHGARDVRHRAGRDVGTPAPVGETITMNVTLYPQEILLAAGHRLVLSIAAEDADWWVPSPAVGATFTLELGDGRTQLRLPVSMGTPAFGPDDAQRTRSPLPALETMI